MAVRVEIGRGGTLALVGSALCALVLAGSPAGAQCVGDCGSTGMVRINDLVLGVNIALDLRPVADCEAFANAQGVVDISQLVKGVNNALDGCS